MKLLLYPFAFLYGLAVRLRNLLYNLGWRSTYRSQLPVILVGNLSAGGTGKTPAVLWLLEQLGPRYKMAVLSRGYGRQSSQPHLAKKGDGPRELGDEPALIQTHFPTLPIYLDGNRRRALLWFERNLPRPDVVVMDDGFQHRAVRAWFNIVLTTWQKPFHRDNLLPFGKLREPASGLQRAQALVVTKCPPTLGSAERAAFLNELPLPQGLPVFFASLAYDRPQWVHGAETTGEGLLITGIAEPSPLVEYLNIPRSHHRIYPDHHTFSQVEIDKLYREMNLLGCTHWITTEKDWMRLQACELPAALNVAVVPVKMDFFEEGGHQLVHLIESQLQRFNEH